MLVALRRVFALLDQLDDQRITPDEDAEIRRRLREEISLLWRTSALRMERPSPLDEVRNALLFFDESLFVVTPRLYRALDRPSTARPGSRTEHAAPIRGAAATDTGRTGTRPPAAHAFLRWGSWVGSDRDGHPRVTAETTRQAAAIGADHVLRGLEAVTTRLMHTVAPTHARRRPRAAPGGSAGAGPPRPGRGLRGARPPLPQRALSPPPGSHGRAPAADPPPPRGRARAWGRLRLAGAAARGGRRAAGVARGRPHGACRLRGGPGPALAGGDLRLPRPVARGAPAQRGPRRDARRHRRGRRTSRRPWWPTA